MKKKVKLGKDDSRNRTLDIYMNKFIYASHTVYNNNNNNDVLQRNYSHAKNKIKNMQININISDKAFLRENSGGVVIGKSNKQQPRVRTLTPLKLIPVGRRGSQCKYIYIFYR